jgi:HK97 family phage prohead protease
MTSAVATRASDSSKPYGNVSYADPGYQSDGKARYPLDSEAHCRAAYSYISMPKNAAKYTPAQVARIKSRIMAAGKRYGIEFSGGQRSVPDAFVRAYEFEMRSVSRDGRRLMGRVAVFNTRALIPDRGGAFEEQIYPGFMDRYLRSNGFPVMQFDHGKDPRTGTVPIGKYEVFDGNRSGYDVEGDLFDNPVVEPVRQAIQAGAVKGMSFRMQVTPNGDKWERRSGQIDLRTVTDADVPEAGPVVFPAYRDTRVAVRSILATFDDEERAEMIRELREQAGLATDLTDLTGRSDTRSADGGDDDEEPWEGDPSPVTPPEIRERLLAVALRPEIRLPSQ